MSYGFVYVMSNDAHPNIYKIGCTEKSPNLRAKQLSTTGVAKEFDVVCFGEFKDFEKIEKLIHRELHEYRVSNKEFFNAPLQFIIDLMKENECLLSFSESNLLPELFSNCLFHGIQYG